MAMSSSAKIGKNAAWLVLATTAQKVVAFVAFIVVAHLIGREQTGAYFYAVSITSIFVTFADLGMTPVVIRSISGQRENGERLLGATLRAKILLVPLAILAAFVYTIVFGANPVILTTMAIACLVMSADTLSLALYGALRGRQNLKPEAMGMFVGQILTAAASITAAWLGFGPVGLAVALLLGSSWNVVWSLWQLKRFDLRPLRPQRIDFITLAKEGWPFALAGIAVKVYSYIDSSFLQRFYGSGEVGLYAVAYKLTYALQFLPLTFTAALYPALASAFAKGEEEDIRRTFVGSLRLMAAVSFPLAAGLSALAPRLIPLLYGKDFLGAIPALQALPWVLIPIFLDFPVGSLLNATHRAHLKTTAMVATMFLNALLNAILVPRYASLGACMSALIGFWMLYLIGAYFSRTHVKSLWSILSLTLRGVLAGGISWVAWSLVGSHMVLPAAMLFGGAVAVVCGFTFKLVTLDDVYSIIRHFRPMSPKVEPVHD